MRRSKDPALHSTSLVGIAGRLDQELCKVLDRLVDSLEQCRPVPQLPHSKKLLEELHTAFSELYEGIGDKSEREGCRLSHLDHDRTVWRHAEKRVAECHAQLAELDWQSLNESYF